MTKPILYIVRGVPGSGKSTFVKNVKREEDHHFEADQYFMQSGEYKFDIAKIGAAHQWCRVNTLHSLSTGRTVWVSNTFTTIKELKPYFDIAKQLGSEVVCVTMHGNFGSIHSVPEETMTRMRARFEFDISSLYT